MNKDKRIGAAILLLCVSVASVYTIFVLFPTPVVKLVGITVDASTDITLRLYVVLFLVSLAFIAILAIGAWIGWTMSTTPPPKPIKETITESQTENKTPPPT